MCAKKEIAASYVRCRLLASRLHIEVSMRPWHMTLNCPVDGSCETNECGYSANVLNRAQLIVLISLLFQVYIRAF